MDIDDPQPPHHLAHHTNAVAGPSSLPADIPSLFLPPPGPSFLRQYGSLDFADSPPRSGPPHPKPYFKSTEDLITRFQLLPAYDKYVRPFAPPVAQVGATDKGKGKEIPPLAASSPAAAGPTGGDDGEEEDGAKGEKKHKNYRHLIKAVPGKHSMRKDDYLGALMAIPPKQKTEIKPFSQKTTREAFSVSLEGLKGWNIHALVAESTQAREDRKRRKELKKLAKATGQSIVQAAAAAGPNTPSGVPATPGVAPTPSGVVPVAAPPRTTTPRPGVPRPPPTHQQPSQPRGRTPVGIGTPHSVSTPASGGAAPAPPPAATPAVRTQLDPAAAPPVRGLKREREEGGLQVNGNIPPPGSEGLKIAKAGVAGVRPRPVKKQRLDASGQPFQQPTPHT
ncbi:hypothetical protein C8Q76DRAFT_624998 [Earliella scabrosa]|nr:hypothetical protein C8Q76DRAFT_624998 [Earliella scabrosa]